MGKTRLVGELERLGRERDVLVLGCSVSPAARGGRRVRRARGARARARRSASGPRTLGGCIGEAAAELAVLVPGIGEHAPARRRRLGARCRPSWACSSARCSASRSLLVVEDAHWIDASTAAVVVAAGARAALGGRAARRHLPQRGGGGRRAAAARAARGARRAIRRRCASSCRRSRPPRWCCR